MKFTEIRRTFKGRLAQLEGQDPYTRLGVEPGVSQAELREAYRKKVRAYHPDRSGTFLREFRGQVMRLLNEAYEKIRKEISRGDS